MIIVPDLSLTEIKVIFSDSSQSFVDLVQPLNESNFTAKKSEVTWSIAEVLEHIFNSERLIGIVIAGRKSPSENRDSNLIISQVEEKFGSFEEKFQAFGPIIPSGKVTDKQELLSSIIENREKILDNLNFEELNHLCEKFTHPLFGKLTVIEWLNFILIHSGRHYKQIERLKGEF